MMCWACSLRPDERWKCLDRSMGRSELHHLLTQAELRREFKSDPRLPDLLADRRNLVPIGRWHHAQLHARMFRPVWDDLPHDAVAFASELGLAHILERRFPMKENA